MRCLFIAMAAALVASSAAAQSTTNCRPTYAGAPQLGMTCDTNPAFGSSSSAAAAPKPVYHWQDVKPTPCSRAESLLSNTNYCEARLAAAGRKSVGELIAAGKCDEAVKVALGAGDIGFAREVRDFCAAK